MINCSICSNENPNKNTYCGSCGSRLKPVDRKTRQDILSVLAEQRKQNRARNCTVGMFILAVCGVIGYQGLREMVANQVSALKPAIIREATARAESLVDNEVPKALARVEQGAAVRIAADVKRITQQRSQQVEAIWADSEREARERTQRLAAGYPATLDGAAQNVAWTPGGFSSGALTFPPAQGLAGLVGIEANNLGLRPSDNIAAFKPASDSFLGSVTNYTSVIMQTTYSPVCVGGVLMTITDAAGSHTGTADDCKNQQLFGGSSQGVDAIITHPVKQ
jgi:hypothetical protein